MAELPVVDPNNVEKFSNPAFSNFYKGRKYTELHDGICDTRIVVITLNDGSAKYKVQLRDPKDHDYYIKAFFTSIAYVVLTLGLGLFFLHRFLYNFKWETGSEHEAEEGAKAQIDDYISKRKAILKDRFDKKVKSSKYIKYP